MALLRWPGGKTRLLKTLWPYLDRILTGDSYAEPFVGGGSVALRVAMERPGISLSINDKDADVACFWSVICGSQSAYQALCEAVTASRNPTDDPATRLDFWNEIRASKPADPARRAFRFLLLNKTCFGGQIDQGPMGGWNQDGYLGRKQRRVMAQYDVDNILKNLRHARKLLAGRTTVYNLDFEEFLSGITPTAVYADPPYFPSETNKLYRVSMSEAEHERLAAILRDHPSRWALSYDNSESVRSLYHWAAITEISALYSSSTRGQSRLAEKANGWSKKTELVIVPPSRSAKRASSETFCLHIPTPKGGSGSGSLQQAHVPEPRREKVDNMNPPEGAQVTKLTPKVSLRNSNHTVESHSSPPPDRSTEDEPGRAGAVHTPVEPSTSIPAGFANAERCCLNSVTPEPATDHNEIKRTPLDVVDIPLGNIDLANAIQCRVEENQEQIEYYAECWRRGETLPPIHAFSVESRLITVDGSQRVKAARLAGKQTISAFVHHGSYLDAIRFAVAANSTNGVPRTNADKRKAVVLAISTFGEMSDHVIADMCRVSHPFVGSVRKSQPETLSSSEKRVGKDGKARKLPTKQTAHTSKTKARVTSPQDGAGKRDFTSLETLSNADNSAESGSAVNKPSSTPAVSIRSPEQEPMLAVDELWREIDAFLDARLAEVNDECLRVIAGNLRGYADSIDV